MEESTTVCHKNTEKIINNEQKNTQTYILT